MDSPMKQAAKLVQAKKGGSRMLALFLCLALLVTAGTVTAFVMHGHTQTHTHRVLECSCEVHAHTEDCYPGGDTTLEPTCGLAEFVVHVHNDDCYDEAGALVCTLDEVEVHEHNDDCWAAPLTCTIPEIEPHTHDAGCYAPAEGAVPACGLEEQEAVPGHAHTEECYTAGEAVLACGQDEAPAHHHDDGCYTTTETRELICGQEEGEEHQHGDDCYTVTTSSELTCGQDETDGHSHSEACWQATSVLTCGLEAGEGAVAGHTHTNDCYAEADLAVACGKEETEGHVHGAGCYGEEALVCTKAEIALHIHSEEAGCFAELTEDDKAAGAEHGALTCDKLQVEEHTHGENCFKTEEMTPEEIAAQDAAAQKPGVEDLSLVYSDENIVVTVDYDTAALLPVDAAIELVSADTPAPVLDVTQQAVPVAPSETDAPAGDASEEDADITEEGEGETAQPEEQGEPKAAPEAPAETTPETPAETAPETAAPAEDLTGLVRAGFMADGREWLPAATVTYTVQYLLDGQPAGDPVVYSFTPGGALPSFAPAIETFAQTVETDAFIVTARYTAFAELDGAELYAVAIEDKEQVEAYTAQYREAVNSSRAQMHALMDIGFMLNDTEVQPAAPVEITVQLLGEDGLPAGEPLTVVHFGENTEVIAAKADETGIAAFRMNSFSPVGIGQTPESDDEGRALLNEQNGAFEWTDPNGLYHVTFQVNGVIAPKAEEPAEGEDAGDEDAEAPEEEAAAGAPEDEGEEDAGSEDVPLATAALLEFKVEQLGEEDEAFESYLQAAMDNVEEVLDFSVMRYSLTYGGVEMDLTNCEITVEVTAAIRLQEQAAEYARKNPTDNGDDDHDGYVDVGDATLPAPQEENVMQLDLIAPSGDEDAEQPVAVQSFMQLAGANAVAASEVTVTAPAEDQEPSELITWSTQSTVFTIEASMMRAGTPFAQTFAMRTAAPTNPHFTVQYYARLLRVQQYESGGQLTLIDTSGGNLPQNGVTPKLTHLKVNNGTIEREKEVTKVFQTKEYDYLRAPELIYTNILLLNNNYHRGEKAELWILKSGRNEDSVNEEDWDIYKDLYRQEQTVTTADGIQYVIYTYTAKKDGSPVTLSFTNNTSVTGSIDGITYIPLTDGSVVRWVYQYSEADYDNSAVLYDYDISTGWLYRGINDGDNATIIANLTDDTRRIRPEYMFSVSKTANGYVYTRDLNAVLPTSIAYREKTVWDWVKAAGGDPDTKTHQHFYMNSYRRGINSSGNYSSTNGALLGFGNRNTGSGLGNVTWSNNGVTNNINKHNGVSYGGCTYGLVTGLNNGVIQYADGIIAPKLFNETGTDTVAGKTVYENGQLSFRREGDTYTLMTVRNNGDVLLTNLDRFSNPRNSLGTYNGQDVSTVIWTNNFWPMDFVLSSSSELHDMPFGHSESFKRDGSWDGGATDKSNTRYALGYGGGETDRSGDHFLPESDDGLYHNSYFGMQYQVQFTLDPGYVGPLEYFFFGDDDMWVFLDDQLVCDIGGVHSSVGEYVNLWDYIPQYDRTESETYTLSFFYTERGASGSTCWMQFTLPSVSSIDLDPPDPGSTGSITVRKTVEKVTNDTAGNTETVPFNNKDSFNFKLELKAPNGTTLPDWFRYSIYSDDPNVAPLTDVIGFNNGIFTLSHGQYAVIEGLPFGTEYTITEIEAKTIVETKTGNTITLSSKDSSYVYDTDIIVDGKTVVTDAQHWPDKKVKGTITEQKSEVQIEFVNTYHVFRMPKTGGVPGIVYTGTGAMLILLAAAAYTQRKRRKKAEETPAK